MDEGLDLFQVLVLHVDRPRIWYAVSMGGRLGEEGRRGGATLREGAA
jgi:hypothetical protein